MSEGILTRAIRFEERSELERWASSGEGDRARRARIVLMASQGRSTRDIAELCGSHPVNVKKWIRRFNERGVSGLDELKRGPKKGTRARFSEEQERAILELAAEEPRALGFDFDVWSPQKLADAAVARGIVAGISHVTVRAMLRGATSAGEPEMDEPPAAEPAALSPLTEATGDVLALSDAGQAALDASDNRTAADRFREALEAPGLSVGTEALLRCRLAQALEGLARYEEALDAVRKYDEPAVLATLPMSVRALVKLRLGWVFSWLHNFPRAVAKLNEAVKIFRELDDSDGIPRVGM